MNVKIIKESEKFEFWYQIARIDGKWRLDYCGEITYPRTLKDLLAKLSYRFLTEVECICNETINEVAGNKQSGDVFIVPPAVLS